MIGTGAVRLAMEQPLVGHGPVLRRVPRVGGVTAFRNTIHVFSEPGSGRNGDPGRNSMGRAWRPSAGGIRGGGGKDRRCFTEALGWDVWGLVARRLFSPRVEPAGRDRPSPGRLAGSLGGFAISIAPRGDGRRPADLYSWRRRLFSSSGPGRSYLGGRDTGRQPPPESAPIPRKLESDSLRSAFERKRLCVSIPTRAGLLQIGLSPSRPGDYAGPETYRDLRNLPRITLKPPSTHI